MKQRYALNVSLYFIDTYMVFETYMISMIIEVIKHLG